MVEKQDLSEQFLKYLQPENIQELAEVECKQAEFIIKDVINNFKKSGQINTIIAGYPGTGKSTILRCILNMLHKKHYYCIKLQPHFLKDIEHQSLNKALIKFKSLTTPKIIIKNNQELKYPIIMMDENEDYVIFNRLNKELKRILILNNKYKICPIILAMNSDTYYEHYPGFTKYVNIKFPSYMIDKIDNFVQRSNNILLNHFQFDFSEVCNTHVNIISNQPFVNIFMNQGYLNHNINYYHLIDGYQQLIKLIIENNNKVTNELLNKVKKYMSKAYYFDNTYLNQQIEKILKIVDTSQLKIYFDKLQHKMQNKNRHEQINKTLIQKLQMSFLNYQLEDPQIMKQINNSFTTALIFISLANQEYFYCWKYAFISGLIVPIYLIKKNTNFMIIFDKNNYSNDLTITKKPEKDYELKLFQKIDFDKNNKGAETIQAILEMLNKKYVF